MKGWQIYMSLFIMGLLHSAMFPVPSSFFLYSPVSSSLSFKCNSRSLAQIALVLFSCSQYNQGTMRNVWNMQMSSELDGVALLLVNSKHSLMEFCNKTISSKFGKISKTFEPIMQFKSLEFRMLLMCNIVSLWFCPISNQVDIWLRLDGSGRRGLP